MNSPNRLSSLFSPLTVATLLTVIFSHSSLARFFGPPITPKFGTPLVTSNQLIFTYPDARKPSIISISRDTGDKLWEIAVTNKDVQLWPATGNPIVSIDTNIFELNLTTGTLQHRLQTDFEIERLYEASPTLLLLQQRAWDIRTNLCIAVQRTDWTRLWARSNIHQILDSDRDRILVLFGEPDFSGQRWVSHGWPMKDMAIALLNPQDGKPFWQRPTSVTFMGETAILADDYVVISGTGKIACVSARDGSLLNRTNTHRADTGARVWRDGAGVFSNFSVNLVASLDLPSLKSKILFRHAETFDREHHAFIDDIYLVGGRHGISVFDAKSGRTLWQTARPPIIMPDAYWDWRNIHNKTVYVSRANLAENEAVIYALDIQTGRSRKLFSAPLPREH